MINQVSINLNGIELGGLATHFVGCPQYDIETILSQKLTDVNEDSEPFLLKYFVLPIKQEEIFSFRQGTVANQVQNWVKDIFADSKQLLEKSQLLAQKLFDCSGHVAIKEGYLNVAYFKHLEVNNQEVEAVGIFKTETDEVFLKMLQQSEEENFVIGHDYGYPMNALDKGCIILNYEAESNYTILMLDKAKGNEAKYWQEAFLDIEPIKNEFTQTNDWISLTTSFVKENLVEETLPTERIEIMNRAADYFKESESFQKEEFEAAVLKDEPVIQSFRTYNSDYRVANEVELEDEFEISQQAVKKQGKVFKSVLKLDKNFHVYIHGNKDLIERGTEDDGRKYYKLYYESEQ
jgi:hypothetical protein